MTLYFMVVRSKEAGYMVPLLTDEYHVVSSYEKLSQLFEGGAVFIHEAILNNVLDTFTIGEEVSIDSLR